VYGILNFAFALGMMVGPLLGSALVQLLGIRAALALLGLGCGAFALRVRRISV